MGGRECHDDGVRDSRHVAFSLSVQTKERCSELLYIRSDRRVGRGSNGNIKNKGVLNVVGTCSQERVGLFVNMVKSRA